MTHLSSIQDQEFRAQVESCEFPVEQFNHRAHLRLAYIYLTENDTGAAHESMRTTLHRFLAFNEVDPAKYHETMTRAWIMAVRHFMAATAHAESADAFIDQNPRMLDGRIMMTHYSSERLFSEEARARFVKPDLDPIPRHAER